MDCLPVLFVDDDQSILDLVREYLARHQYRVDTAASGEAAVEKIRSGDYAAVVTDLIMPGIGGLEVLKTAKEANPSTEVIILTGHGSIESAIEALKLGSYDYIQKPINLERLKIMLGRICEKRRLEQENSFFKQRLKERYNYDQLVGRGTRMQQVYSMIDRISTAAPTVLIRGESGTGKELVANVIHQNSPRNERPFIPVNCGAIVEGLLESELFGHVRGAFTGAIKDSPGLFKAADGGTIFLDEIGEIPPTLQVKLLRALQERKIRSVGDTREVEVDVRVISATNQNLEEAVKNKSFREDLYYRLNVISIHMPPLREMKEDIPGLVQHFITKLNQENGRSVTGVAPDALQMLMRFDWPGNVRQLENVMQRAFALGLSDVITVADLPDELVGTRNAPLSHSTNLNLMENEKVLIVRALKRTAGNKAQAAKLLGINLTTVYRKMEKYRLRIEG